MHGHPLTVQYKQNPRDAIKQVAEAYLEAGCEVVGAAETLGVSRWTIYSWLKAWPELEKALTLARVEYSREQLKRLKSRKA